MNTTDPGHIGYRLGALLGSTEEFEIYACEVEGHKACILKLAVTPANNGLLDREALLLRTLTEAAERLELGFGERCKGKDWLNYQFVFPRLLDSFIVPIAGDRRVNIMSLSEICSDISELVPLGHIASRDHQRVDPKTSAWILGKLLKTLVFAHSLGIALVGEINGDNILVNRDEHFVCIFDWSGALEGPSAVDDEAACVDISLVAIEVIEALGGDRRLETLPESEQLEGNGYAEFIFGLANGVEHSAIEAHRKHYELVRAIWPRGFHPFTAYPVNS